MHNQGDEPPHDALTAASELARRGCSPPPINLLKDADVTRELTNLIWNLADMRIYISETDHLDDRALYSALLEYCDETQIFFPNDDADAIHWSPIGPSSDEDTQIYLRFYADEETRARWRREFKVALPPRARPPYPRPWIPVRPNPA